MYSLPSIAIDIYRRLLFAIPSRFPPKQPRHWEIIENIIGHHFTPEEPMTLGLLIELEAFKHTEAIQEVPGQASSEASLEAILKKVCALNELALRYHYVLACKSVRVALRIIKALAHALRSL